MRNRNHEQESTNTARLKSFQDFTPPNPHVNHLPPEDIPQPSSFFLLSTTQTPNHLSQPALNGKACAVKSLLPIWQHPQCFTHFPRAACGSLLKVGVREDH